MRRLSTWFLSILLIVGASCAAAGSRAVHADSVVPLGGQYFGVNLAGAEFGSNMPGTNGADYTFPTAQELAYYASKGMRVVRLPFRWERAVDGLYGPLDQAYVGNMDAVVKAAAMYNIAILLDMHNYDRYRLNGADVLVGDPSNTQVPARALADAWVKLAAHYASTPNIYAYDIMNEPHDTGDTWHATAQAVVNAIRSVDTTHYIAVEGDGWAGAQHWASNNPNLAISDAAGKFFYEAHEYFDSDASGTYPVSYASSGAYPTIGVDRIAPFVSWAAQHGVKGFLGEYGIPNTDGTNDNDGLWLTVLDNALSYMRQNAGTIIGGTYWASGPWWGNYALSAEPSNLGQPSQQDAVQMSVLQKYASTPAAPTATPVGPTATAIPASPTPTATPAPPTSTPGGVLVVSASGSASPAAVTPGQNVALSGTAWASAPISGAIIDLEMYNAAGTQVYQNFQTVSLAANTPQTVYATWSTPPSQSTGTYTLKVGVFGPGWNPTYAWNNGAATFTVGGSATSTPTSAPATSTPTPTTTKAGTSTPTPTQGGGNGVTASASAQAGNPGTGEDDVTISNVAPITQLTLSIRVAGPNLLNPRGGGNTIPNTALSITPNTDGSDTFVYTLNAGATVAPGNGMLTARVDFANSYGTSHNYAGDTYSLTTVSNGVTTTTTGVF